MVNGRVAAIGRVALTVDVTIYDRIETYHNYRRRLLDSTIMSALEAIALDQAMPPNLLYTGA